MKVVVAIDSFKGSLSSKEINKACYEGIHEVDATIEIITKELADGGEGTLDCIIDSIGGVRQSIMAKDPLFRNRETVYGIIPTEKKAIVEMAKVAGLTLLKKEECNPMNTTTYGLGEIIIDAINQGIRDFMIGIGGSVTSEAGIGMLMALGYQFLDEYGQMIVPIAKNLINIYDIDDTKVDQRLKESRFQIVCDVKNPLFGLQGAAYVYAPQKGANKEEVELIDQGLHHFSTVVSKKYGIFLEDEKGAGAAGGLGYAFLSFLNSELVSGITKVMELINLEEEIKNADIVITGEGKLDAQTLQGKLPVGVAYLAKKYAKKVIAIAGSIEGDIEEFYQQGIDACFCIHQKIVPLAIAMDKQISYQHAKDTIKQIFRLLLL